MSWETKLEYCCIVFKEKKKLDLLGSWKKQNEQIVIGKREGSSVVPPPVGRVLVT